MLKQIRRYIITLLLLCLCGVPLLATEDAGEEIEENRDYISKDIINFSKNSDWEGVWGDISQCNPLSTEYYICAKKNNLSIYDCDMQNMTCKLSFVKFGLKNFNAYEKYRIITCDQYDRDGVYIPDIDIKITGNSAKVSEKFLQKICVADDKSQKEMCRENFNFSLTKSEKGITFHSSKNTDSVFCESDKITLNGTYPRLNASFDCQKAGLNKVEKGICNSFTAIKVDLEMNTIYNFLMDFARTDEEKNKLKSEQLQWLAELNKGAKDIKDAEILTGYIFDKFYARVQHLRKMLDFDERTDTIQPPFTLPPKRVHMNLTKESVKIYDKPSLDSQILHTATLKDKANINLLSKRTYNGFRKIHYLEFWRDGKSEQEVAGYVKSEDIKYDSVD